MTTGEIGHPDTNEWTSLARRDFLKLLGPGIYIFFALEELFPFAQEQRGGRGYPEDFNAYLRIAEDGRVTCFTGKIEMGQGINASLAQMLAEELEVPYNSVSVVLGDTQLCPWDGGTNGSRSLRYFGPSLRVAGVEARKVLIQLAAESLKVPENRLTVKDGVISDRADPGKNTTYGALARGKIIERHLTKKPDLSDLKRPADFKVCGKPLPRPDLRDKVMGRAQYAGDIRLPGMIYARVLRAPVHGARLKSVDVSAAKEIKDVLVLQSEDLVAALHELPDQAAEALSRIKAQYDLPEATVTDKTIHQHLIEAAAPQGNVVREKGDLAQGREIAALKFDETYFAPYVAHASMETHTALAQVQADAATVWISTQRPFGAQTEIAQALGMAAEKVRIITPFVGGGFGGKSQITQAVQAARLSKMAGKPVQVAWTREDEFFNDTFQPAAVVQISSGLNMANQIVFWDYQVLFAGERSSEPIYEIPHQRTVSRGAARGASAHPFGTGAWRGPGSNTNIFARESHIDVMAAKAGVDPVEFRLKNLTDARMVRVLKAAADRFGWKPAKAPSGRGYGAVCLDYLETYVAAMAEVGVDKTSGKIQVKRIVVAEDMGQVINPEGAKMQIEGGVTMGLGYCLSEEIHFIGGDVKDTNFDTYEITRFSRVPQIDVVLIDNPALDPRGNGEAPITCMGGVIANALFDATGVRLNRLPLTPERIKEKLASL